jgi:gliding motility-associated-like protein
LYHLQTHLQLISLTSHNQSMKKFFSALVALFFISATFAQQSPTTNWTARFDEQQSFIENKGQFDGRNRLPGSDILYAVDNGELQIFFTKNGLSYYVEKKYKNPDRKKGDRSKPKLLKEYEVTHIAWEGASANTELKGFDMKPDHHTYSFINKETKEYYAIDEVYGYKKLVYKNLYPNVDVEYVFHPQGGIKYSVILHPGADASQVRMKYSGNPNISLSAEGKIIIPTFHGNIVEHAPVTFYADNSSDHVRSKFNFSNNTVSFQLGNYDRAKEIVIDPWVQTPTLPGSNCVWECEQDAAGNVYIIGGETPMRLQKYSPLGALQWTYNTPYDTNSGDWLGTLATDRNGNSYVTNGSTAELSKVGTNGGPAIYSVIGGALDEYWSVQFNCDQTKLVVGGTRPGPLPPAGSNGVIFEINANNGSVISRANVASTRSYVINIPIFGPTTITDINEVRAITSSRNAKYYYLTLDTVGAINQNLAACSAKPVFGINSTYNFGYKSENYRPVNGNSGICAIRANAQFVYSQNGTTVHKRSLTTGTIITSATLPGGSTASTVIVGGTINQPENNGIDIDDCGNVYVGSGDRVIKFDANLNVLSSVTVPFRVYDVAVSTNGNIIAAGATGTNDNNTRVGYVQSINMSACAPFTLICCDASVCPVSAVCSNASPFNLTPVQSGGTWSGPGITNTSTGTFNPSIAGVGTHYIAYTLSCGSDTISIVVNNCATLTVCKEQNGDLTVSGGTGPYTWESGTPFQNCSGCFFGMCSPFCPGFADTTWTTFATTPTAAPPSSQIIRVRDSGVNKLLITNTASLPNCTTVVCPTITVTVPSKTNITCNGANNGSATVSASGGTSPYTYLWQPGNLTGATRNNLAPGTYNVTATDVNNCTGTTSLTITQPNAVTANASKTDATCAGNNGTATATAGGGTSPYTYAWSNNATTAAISSLAPGNYTVTVRDANNCSATATVTVSSSGGPTVTLNTQTNILCFGGKTGAIDINVSAGVSPYTYLWSNSATTQDITGLFAGSYSVTVTDNNNCVSIFNATITEPAALSLSGIETNASCGANDGAIDLTVQGGTTPYNYIWSNGASTQDLANIPSGNYAVTVSDQNGCTDSVSFSVLAPGNMELSLNATDASCEGVNNGGVTSTVSGGNAPLVYSWSTGATTADISNVGSGTYTLTVTDASNCSVVATANVGAIQLINLRANITGIKCSYDTVGSIKLIISGGTGPYNAQWGNGVSGFTITGLVEGNYAVTVTDANGCQADSVFALISSSALQVSASATALSCTGTGTGSVIAVATGNFSPFEYLWNTNDTTQVVSNLSPGTYSVTVTDSLGCIGADTTIVGVSTIVLTDKNLTQPQCIDSEDGYIEVIITNGTPPYVYFWSTGQDSMVAINLNAGVHTVTVTDANNCILVDTTVLVALETCDSLQIYDVFSPNGDGFNDLWIIDGLTNYPNNELQIFNRWGSLVFEAKPYQNNWDGRSKNGNPLPSATYYYILKPNDGTDRTYSGPVALIR